MRILTVITWICLNVFSHGEITAEEAKIDGMRETLQNYIEHNPVIADICIFEQTWMPPSKSFPKGRMIQRAVVTHVHRGSISVGTRIEYAHYIEDSPRLFDEFTSTVRGKLRTFFFDPNDSSRIVDGVLKIDGDGHWGFNRVDDVFSELFALELKSNPKLQPKDSDGAANPAKPGG